jgi:hypothetical protein
MRGVPESLAISLPFRVWNRIFDAGDWRPVATVTDRLRGT